MRLAVSAVANVGTVFDLAVANACQPGGVGRQRGFDFFVVGVEVLHQNTIRPRPAGELVVGCLLTCHKITSQNLNVIVA